MSIKIHYPPTTSDVEREISEALARHARDRLSPSDVLAKVNGLLMGLLDDTDHPHYALVKFCTEHGTYQETHKLPHVAEQVGAAFLPLIDEAIAILVEGQLNSGTAMEDD